MSTTEYNPLVALARALTVLADAGASADDIEALSDPVVAARALAAIREEPVPVAFTFFFAHIESDDFDALLEKAYEKLKHPVVLSLNEIRAYAGPVLARWFERTFSQRDQQIFVAGLLEEQNVEALASRFETTLNAVGVSLRKFDRFAAEMRKVMVDEANSRIDDSVMMARTSDFGFSERVRNVLARREIHTVLQLSRLSKTQLLSFSNLGTQSVAEIEDHLAGHGIGLHA